DRTVTGVQTCALPISFPKMLQNQNALGAGITLGALWGLWHLPVIDYLGTATPHGAYWLRYFLAFTAVVSAMRVLIAWIYTHTNRSEERRVGKEGRAEW